MPPEAISPCSSCHFNSLYFTYMQRLEGCQWNHNKCSSASTLFGGDGTVAPSSNPFLQSWEQCCWVLKRLAEGTDLCHTDVQMAVLTLTCETGQQCLTGETYLVAVEHRDESCWRCRQSCALQFVSGAGSLHSPSPGLLDPSFAGSVGLVWPWKLTWGKFLKLLFFPPTLFLLH